MTKSNMSPRCSRPLVWITKTLTEGDTNTRVGIAECINGIIRRLEVPNEFCTHSQIVDRLTSAGLINPGGISWPDVLIGPSLHIPYMQEIKNMSGGKTIVVALRTPARAQPIEASRRQICNTDIVVSYPYHNNDNIPNIMICEYLPNRITPEMLKVEKLNWADRFSHFFKCGPVIGMIVGGDIGDGRRIFSNDAAVELGATINQIAANLNASILLSMSSRTTAACKRLISEKIKVPKYIYDPKIEIGDNPYYAILGSVDYLVVTADSISMCCEAVSSGKPVYIYCNEDIIERTHKHVVESLIADGYARLLNVKDPVETFSYNPINTAWNVANRINEILTDKR